MYMFFEFSGFCQAQESVSQYRFRFNNKQYIITTTMLSDDFPVFNIDLDVDFESSDNVFPSYNNSTRSNKVVYEDHLYESIGPYTRFSNIGQRNSNLDCTQIVKTELFDLIAIYDGHCDIEPVSFVESNLLKKLKNHPLLMVEPIETFFKVFAEIEKQVVQKFEKGCAALVALKLNDQLIVANLGDCKLLGVNESGHIKQYTTSHNLSNNAQLQKVINRGGLVFKKGNQYRINGQLNLSRSLGDRKHKPFMSSQPQIFRVNIKESKRWIFATDGFYKAKFFENYVVGPCLLKEQDKNAFHDNASALFLDV